MGGCVRGGSGGGGGGSRVRGNGRGGGGEGAATDAKFLPALADILRCFRTAPQEPVRGLQTCGVLLTLLGCRLTNDPENIVSQEQSVQAILLG